MIHSFTPLPRSEGASLTSQPYDNPLGLVQVHHMPHHNNRPCGPLDLILQHLLNMLQCYILALIHKQTPSSFVCAKPFDIPQQPCWWPQTYNHRTPYHQQKLYTTYAIQNQVYDQLHHRLQPHRPHGRASREIDASSASSAPKSTTKPSPAPIASASSSPASTRAATATSAWARSTVNTSNVKASKARNPPSAT